MPTLLFWNLCKRNLGTLAAYLARDTRADIVVLAECSEPMNSLLNEFNSDGSPFYDSDPGFPDRFAILSLYPRSAVEIVRDTFGISIRHYSPPIGQSFSIVAVHLQSKRYQNENDQSFLSTRVAQVIQKAEADLGHSRTIAIGDFNMNPFEPGMIAAGGLHATMDRRIALRDKRVVQEEEHPFFYNPMWSHLGDKNNSVPGSYFYNNSSRTNLFWHAFDQVLLRPSLLSFFTDDNVQVITKVRGINLLGSKGRPNAREFSDHLPIALALRDLGA